MGARKDKIHVDILFDDALHNVLNSTAQYPILMRRPWNADSTGMLAVNNYDEFLKIVEIISSSYAKRDDAPLLSEPSIVVLVGPSGCGKSKLARRILQKTDAFEKLISYTTKDPTAEEENEWYHYVSLDTFRQMTESGEMFQSTMYSGHSYGSVKSDIEKILQSGKHVLTTMDICGAMSLKTHFKNVTTIYIRRQKKAIISNLLRKKSSVEDKANRIMAIDFAEKTADLCDYVVKFDLYDEAEEKLSEILRLNQS
jgi:guanylate kinase